MTNKSACGDWSDTVDTLANQLSIVAYRGITPFYFVIGMITRGICLIAFYKQYKKEKAFAYQIYSSLSQLLEVIMVSLCILTRNNLSGYRLPGVIWYQKSYGLMWYAACLASPLDQSFVTICLLISLSMAADRALALAKPLIYRSLNHKRIQLIAMAMCFALGLSTSIFDVFRYHVIENDDRYIIVIDQVYTSLTIAVIFGWFRNIIRIIGNLSLVMCNITMVICYRMKVVDHTEGNQQRIASRKFVQKTLLLLTICQSVFTTIEMTTYNTYYILLYDDPSFYSCFSRVLSPVCYLVQQMAGILNVFILFAISKQFRETIFRCLCINNF